MSDADENFRKHIPPDEDLTLWEYDFIREGYIRRKDVHPYQPKKFIGRSCTCGVRITGAGGRHSDWCDGFPGEVEPIK